MDNVTGRFFVVGGSDVPADVAEELESYRADAHPAAGNMRCVTGDLVVAVLGGLVSAGIWDELPLWCMWVSAMTFGMKKASAEEIADSVAALCVRTGLAATAAEVVVDQLIEVSRLGWQGRAAAGVARIAFRSDARGRILMFDSLSDGMPRARA